MWLKSYSADPVAGGLPTAAWLASSTAAARGWAGWLWATPAAETISAAASKAFMTSL